MIKGLTGLLLFILADETMDFSQISNIFGYVKDTSKCVDMGVKSMTWVRDWAGLEKVDIHNVFKLWSYI